MLSHSSWKPPLLCKDGGTVIHLSTVENPPFFIAWCSSLISDLRLVWAIRRQIKDSLSSKKANKQLLSHHEKYSEKGMVTNICHHYLLQEDFICGRLYFPLFFALLTSVCPSFNNVVSSVNNHVKPDTETDTRKLSTIRVTKALELKAEIWVATNLLSRSLQTKNRPSGELANTIEQLTCYDNLMKKSKEKQAYYTVSHWRDLLLKVLLGVFTQQHWKSIWVNEGRFLSHQRLLPYILFMLHIKLAPFHFQITLMFSFPQETNFHYLKA